LPLNDIQLDPEGLSGVHVELFNDVVRLADIEKLLSDLLIASERSDAERIIRELVEAARREMATVVALAVERIETGNYDGGKWSSLALTIMDVSRNAQEPGEILKSLVETDQENGAYLNNFGVFMEMQGQIGEAIKYYARAYATDYKAHGHEKATSFPAWVNLSRIASSLVSKPLR
jgi:tetratricopeptide (TPR) repeat protein